MSHPRVRTNIEMSFYASLEACAACGTRVAPEKLGFYGSNDAWSLTGWCPHCRGPLTFTFLSNGNPIEGICPVGELGVGRSLIIAPSKLMDEVEHLSPTIQLDPTQLPIGPWKLNRDTNHRVLICLAELAKFFPEGADELPTEFLGATDLTDRAARPARYRRGWVEWLTDHHRRIVATITADFPRIQAIDTELARQRPKGIRYLERDALVAHDAWVRRGKTGAGRLVLVGAEHERMRIGRGVELAGVRMLDVNLTGVYLEDASLVDAELDNVRLEGGSLYGSRLHRAQLNGGSLEAADLKQAEFTDARIDGTRFDRSLLDHTSWRGAQTKNARFHACHFGNANLDGGTFTDCDFSGADFTAPEPQRPPTTRAHFDGCDLRNTRWHGRDLRGASFFGCQLAGAEGLPPQTDSWVTMGPSTTELARLLADVVARPTDPAPRRVYADAVRPRNFERAELIDCQLALRDALRANAESPHAVYQRAKLLLHQCGRSWARAIVPMVDDFAYYGGFVEYVRVGADRLAQAAQVLPTLAPIRHLRLEKLHGKVETLLGLPPTFLRSLVSLDLRHNDLDDAEVIAIVTSPHLVHVALLDLGRNHITEASLLAIKLPALRYVETDRTGAELVEVGGEDWGGTPPSRHFRSLRGRLVAVVGDVAWLRDVEAPHLDTL